MGCLGVGDSTPLGRGAVASESLFVDGVELTEGGSVGLAGVVDGD